jgi:ribonuclease BN (tRNA processing enzyme)
MARLNALGTGAGLLNPLRNASSYLMETDHGDVLLDAGEPVSATLAKRDYDWSRLSGIIITHTHADHVGGLPMLIQQLHLSGRTNPLDLYGPSEFVERLRDYFGPHYLIMEAMKFEVRRVALVQSEAFEIAGVHFTPTSTKHLEPARKKVSQFGYPNRCESFALCIRTGSVSYFYSGDVRSFEDIRDHIGSAAVAILDSTHVDTDQLVDWAAAHPQCQVVLSHVVPNFDDHRLLAQARSAGAENLRLARDGEVIQL